MAAPQKFLLRVYLHTDTAMKLTLNSRPKSVEELKIIMQYKFKPRLDGSDFTIQYEDPDFDGQLSVLVDIDELPEKGTLKVIRLESDDSSSCGSSDTDILPHVPFSQRQKNWPDVFPVPTFNHEVEHVLDQGNFVFQTSGKPTRLTRSQKHNVLEIMAQTIYSFKPYPSNTDICKASEALITAHPCLKELGSKTGWYGWKVSLAFKMGNYRQKLAKSGCAEVSINAGKRSKNNPDSDHPHANIKRARRSEVNFLPNFPTGENQASLDLMRLEIIEETDKSEKNLQFIEKLMQTTFALRRQDIIKSQLPVKDLLRSWPALQLESQVLSEFHRITNVNLRSTFYAELDRHTPRLLNLYRQKAVRTGKLAEALRATLAAYDLQEEHVISRRTLSLCALPVYLREDGSAFFQTFNEEEEPDYHDVPLALGITGADPFSCKKFTVVIEGNAVFNEVPTIPDSFMLLFGLTYVFNLEYPKSLLNTFTMIQKMFVCLDDGKPLKPCLMTLKEDLLLQ
ncbi:uncharacterized protein LOC134467049 [Engraulis encrasicolus]|uniref:uncharacterized protein LOC134467049 n=1 Tax=Engraulis encrasicolus TaxID=184585 RepID=UPI002FCE95E6